MLWLYRLQQRLSITRQEGLAVVTLAMLFLTGLAVRHVQEQQVPPPTVDSLVVHRTAASAPVGSSGPDASPSPSAENPINVNTASKSALEALPGIGPVTAKRIDRYRSTQRPFQQTEELKRVRGIGPKTLATLEPLVRVAPPDTVSS